MARRLHRGAERRELADAQHFAGLDRMEDELERGRDGECSLRADQQPGRVVTPGRGRRRRQRIDIVAADPAQHFWKTGGDLHCQVLAERLQPGRQLADDLRRRRGLPGPIGTEAETRAVGEDRVDRRDIVGHQPVADRLAAAGIVGRHAADGAAGMRRRIDRKEQAMRLQGGVEMAEHDARLDHGAAPIGVDLQHVAEIFRAVEDQRSIDRLAALAGAAAARQHRDAALARDRHRGLDILDRARHENADGLDLVDGCVGRVAAAVGARKQHLALRLPPEPSGELRLQTRLHDHACLSTAQPLRRTPSTTLAQK